MTNSLLKQPTHSLWQKLRARLWQQWRSWRFRLFQQQRYAHLSLEHVRGFDLVVLPEVYNPGLFETGALLVDALATIELGPSARVLDMGTGTGLGAIAAAQISQHVTAADINPHAVRCTRINCLLNQVDHRVIVVESDLFASLADVRYDLVLFNPPFFRGTPADWLDHAWRSTHVIERFAQALPHHLSETGCALVVLSSNADEATFLDAFRENGLNAAIVQQHDHINEIITIYKLERAAT